MEKQSDIYWTHDVAASVALPRDGVTLQSCVDMAILEALEAAQRDGVDVLADGYEVRLYRVVAVMDESTAEEIEALREIIEQIYLRYLTVDRRAHHLAVAKELAATIYRELYACHMEDGGDSEVYSAKAWLAENPEVVQHLERGRK